MIGIEFNDAVLVNQIKALDAVMMTDSGMEEKVRHLIREVVIEARTKVSQAASSAMASDPRGSARAVRNVVYKQILGANINIYNKKRGSGTQQTTYTPPRTLQPGQRGGNRVPRGERTKQVDGYEARQRGFILRFINSGAYGRVAGTRGGKLSGNRGDIAARDFFSGSAESDMTEAADRLANMISEEIELVLNEQ